MQMITLTRRISLFNLLLLLSYTLLGQTNQTANDYVPPFNETFQMGSVLGYYGRNWEMEDLAHLLAGTPDGKVQGVGSNCFRLKLTDSFIEKYKKNRINEAEYRYFGELGCKNNVVFLEGPSDLHRENKEYCAGYRSKMFANLYEPIWDNGENGTPVNENNYYAAFVYYVATNYENVRFWEIINEPDFSYYFNISTAAPGTSENWWDTDPNPCHTENLRAPIQSYIRTLRIAYEVIKSIKPNDYICIGGIGRDSFLDAILRNTDNPDNGKVTDQFPLKGGAYFDCMSYHIYPMFFLKKWTKATEGMVYFRHSDAAVEVFEGRKKTLEKVLFNYGYDGKLYPKKRYMMSESNIPSKPFDKYIGSHEAQRNYIMKALVKSQAIDLDVFLLYLTADLKTDTEATKPYDAMGLYKYIADKVPGQERINPAGIGFRNVSYFIKDKFYSKSRTNELNLPNNIDGGAFKDDNGDFIYVLWAKTSKDMSEEATARYSFPASWKVDQLIQYNWDFTESQDSTVYNSNDVILHGYPTFIKIGSGIAPANTQTKVTATKVVTPNGDGINDFWEIEELAKLKDASVLIFDYSGVKVYENKGYDNGWNATINGKDLPAGAYYYVIKFSNSEVQTGGIRVIR